MRHGTLNREQAIAIMGLDLVNMLDGINCDFTNRLQADGDDSVEFSSSLRGIAKDDREERVLVAYYYQSPEDIEAAGEDLGNCDWEIEGYEIV